jgi:hypothetical protein
MLAQLLFRESQTFLDIVEFCGAELESYRVPQAQGSAQYSSHLAGWVCMLFSLSFRSNSFSFLVKVVFTTA